MTNAASPHSIDPLRSELEASKAEPWKGVCSSGCYRAKSGKKKCKCRCSGKLHGRSHQREENKIDEISDPK